MNERDAATETQTTDQEEPTSLYQPAEDEFEAPASQYEGSDTITWTASEFIAHNKTPDWYVKLVLATLLIAGLIFLLTRDVISTAVIVIAGIAMVAYGARQPRELQYTLDQRGLTIAERFFPYDGFRSFSIVDEGVFSGIVFMPLKRFGQLTTIYIDPNEESKVIGLLSIHLAFDKKKSDPIDQLMRRIRF